MTLVALVGVGALRGGRAERAVPDDVPGALRTVEPCRRSGELEDRLHQRASRRRLLRRCLRHERRRERAAQAGQRRELADRRGSAWSPDGRRIAIVSNGIPGRGRSAEQDLRHERRRQRPAEADAPAGFEVSGLVAGRAKDRVRQRPRRQLGDLRHERRRDRAAAADACRGVLPAQLAWSPNGQKIAFTIAVTSGPNGNLEIYVMNADGSGQRRLTRSAGARQRPRLVARRAEDRLREQLAGLGHERRRQRAAKADAQRGAQLQSCVVPDGQRIAFERGRRQRDPCGGCPGAWGYEVYVMNADGSGQQRLTRGGSQPHWSPDGRKIAFVSKPTATPTSTS